MDPLSSPWIQAAQLYWHWRHGQLARPEYLHQCEFAKRQCVILAVFYAQELPVERVKRV